MQDDKRIPNLDSKFKLDNIWHPFCPKNRLKMAKHPSKPIFDSFLAKKRSNIIWLEFWGQIWNPLIILHLLIPHLIWFYILIFWSPMLFFEQRYRPNIKMSKMSPKHLTGNTTFTKSPPLCPLFPRHTSLSYVLVHMTDLIHFWAYWHSKTIHLIIY